MLYTLFNSMAFVMLQLKQNLHGSIVLFIIILYHIIYMHHAQAPMVPSVCYNMNSLIVNVISNTAMCLIAYA